VTPTVTPRLFDPVQLGTLAVANRAWVSPMCQYSCAARDGVPTAWHLVHLGAFATGGFGLIVTEATAVVPEGRISPEDTGLWDDAQTEAWRPVVDFVHSQGSRIAVQLAHAGRKASTWSPFSGRSGSVTEADGGWQTVSSTGSPFGTLDAPRSLTTDEARAVPGQFADAARRAHEAGFDAVEVHAAHGYLLHQFLSPLINDRDDEYAGDLAGRARLLRETVAAVRAALPAEVPVIVRISATDWAEGGWDLEQSRALVELLLEDGGVDLVDVSTGGAVAHQEIPVGPAYQVPFARELRTTGMPVGTVGLLEDPEEAEGLLLDGTADVVLLGRAALRDPHWPRRAASVLDLDVDAQRSLYPPQHLTAVPRRVPVVD